MDDVNPRFPHNGNYCRRSSKVAMPDKIFTGPESLTKPLTAGPEEVICLNCGNGSIGDFCNICGQATSTERYSLSTLAQEVYTQLRKIEAAKTVRTVWALIISPGEFVQGYLAGKRSDYINPVRFFFYGFFIEVTVKLAVTRFLPGNAIVEQAQGGLTLELLNFGLTIVWGLLWSVLYYKEDLNLVEYIVAAIFFVAQTFVLSAILLLVMLPFAGSLGSPSAVHTALDLAVYFLYSCIFAYALFNVRWPILILKQTLVALIFIAILWGLLRIGVFSLV